MISPLVHGCFNPTVPLIGITAGLKTAVISRPITVDYPLPAAILAMMGGSDQVVMGVLM